MTLDQAKTLIEEYKPQLDKWFRNDWYVGGSVGLALLGYDLGREFNDLDIICHVNSCDFLDCTVMGQSLHQFIVGPNWTYTRSHSYAEFNGPLGTIDKRIIGGVRDDGTKVEFVFKIGPFNDNILKMILDAKKECAKEYRSQFTREKAEKHVKDLQYLQKRYHIGYYE